MNALQTHDFQCLSTANCLIGVDEAGRGALAGPVVAGACALKQAFFEDLEMLRMTEGFNDSKQITKRARQDYFEKLEFLREEGRLDYCVGMASVEEIARLNILGATRLAMQRALEGLAARAEVCCLPDADSGGPLFQRSLKASIPVTIIVDGRPLRPFPYAHRGIVGGDSRSLVIAMASIVAKVSRDTVMEKLAKKFPAYGFDQHMGYGTKNHRQAILGCGPCPEHRKLFLRKLATSLGNEME